jgi:uncharacterized protein (DUF58 family)
LFKDIFLTRFFFIAIGFAALVFVVSFFLPAIFIVAQIIIGLILSITLVDFFILFNPKIKIEVARNTPKVLSLGDNNLIDLIIKNLSSLKLNIRIYDTLPNQLQVRNFSISKSFEPNCTEKFPYYISPNERGIYSFTSTYIFISSFLKLAERRIVFENQMDVACYPSVLQLKKIELLSMQRTQALEGTKKQRRIGTSYEFEQIKNYVHGDDYRHLNWKATGKMNKLMIDQYEDEKSQQVYFLIDKSRNMLMPFGGLSLLDYSINATLAIANVAVKKQDKVGLITFSNSIQTKLKAERKINQLHKINELLYNEKETELEADFELLYNSVRNFIHGRSMLFLFTNFESSYALQRVLPVLRSMNKLHLLVVIFFENTEISSFANEKVNDLRGIYDTTIAATMLDEKKQILKELNQYGIQSIITKPEELNIATLNKYMQLKATRSL